MVLYHLCNNINVIIYNAVRKQEANSKKFHANRFNISSVEGRRASKRIKRRVSKRSQVAAQAYWYVGGFIGVWTVPTINRVLGFFGIVLSSDTTPCYIFSLARCKFQDVIADTGRLNVYLFADTPSSLFAYFKFVNFIVYMRPRLIQHLQQVSMSMGDDVNEDVKQSKFKQIGSFFFFLEESRKKKRTEEPTMEEEKCQDDDIPENSDCNNNGIVQTLNSLDIVQTHATNGESEPNESEDEDDDVADYGA